MMWLEQMPVSNTYLLFVSMLGEVVHKVVKNNPPKPSLFSQPELATVPNGVPAVKWL